MDQEIKKAKIVLFIVIVTTLIVMGVLGWRGGWFSVGSKVEITNESVERSGMTPSELVSVRTMVLNRISNSTPLSDSERSEIVSYLIGDKILFYGFTEIEKDKIINKLNE